MSRSRSSHAAAAPPQRFYSLAEVVTGSIPEPVPCVFTSARPIQDLTSVSYPDGIHGPDPAFTGNVNALPGKFKYDRRFMLQFKEACTERPANLAPLGAIGLTPEDLEFLKDQAHKDKKGKQPCVGLSDHRRSHHRVAIRVHVHGAFARSSSYTEY
ncbi:hypothetical protein EVG20_g8428 [Dentipellis fragilis]|uniref:Eukaryotic translation initiation factor 4G1 eIF4E-binding domain-containing protein n=1 Tax=Dentipellis fragilis TaxID=205917 RepID=A0A4Y9Y7H4_9AGAM|nr:hypothetical protein EVG20_g8428 [Dentipellis fragilis]